VDSPERIPPALLRCAAEAAQQRAGRPPTAWQISENLRRTGHYYQELRRSVAAIKTKLHDLLFIGAIPAQTLARVEWNPISGQVLSAEETRAVALDPATWGILREGKPVTKERFQEWFYGVHPYGGPAEEYDPRQVGAYYPDLTNPRFQELLLSWAEKQMECGVDGIWIDMLYRQATLLAQMTGDLRHPSVADSLAAASRIVEQIRGYGAQLDKRIYVGSWVGPFVLAELAGRQFPYEPPRMDFVTMSPTIQEVLAKRLDRAKWEKLISLVRRKYVDVPLMAFIDWSFDESPLVAVSQRLTKEEQREALRNFDETFRELGILFAYPVHGGYLGRGEATSHLAFGRHREYDAVAPEFQTYETIRDLARTRR